MLSFSQVSYTYSPLTKRQIKKGLAQTYELKDITFTIEQGDFFGIAGHTGSGKSTLAQHMIGLMKPTMGSVTFEDQEVSDKNVAANICAQIGLVFQYPEQQLFAASVFEDVAFGPKNLGVPEAQWEERVAKALTQVGLDYESYKDLSPLKLSGGEQRRVALAGTLAMEPDMLVFDEPTAGLDPKGQEAILELVDSLHRQGKTIVMISHSMNDLAKYANKILVLNQGSVAHFGSPDQVFSEDNNLEQIGLSLPDAQAMAQDLRASGVPLPKMFYTADSLAEELAKLLG